jgi:hypothetical protein
MAVPDVKPTTAFTSIGIEFLSLFELHLPGGALGGSPTRVSDFSPALAIPDVV